MDAIYVLKLRDLFPGKQELYTREEGEIVRKEILNKLSKYNKILLDFEGFTLVTQSFVSEIIDKIAREKSIEFVTMHVSITNACDFIRKMFSSTIIARVKKQNTRKKK